MPLRGEMTDGPDNSDATPRRDSGRANGSRRRRRPLGLLEWLTILHAGSYLVLTTWAFGGQADWVRIPLTAWGGAGFLITLSALLRPGRENGKSALGWALPIVIFNVIVLLGAMNPSFREVRFAGETLLAHRGERNYLPSTALPSLARQMLWQFDAIWVTAFNLVLVVHRRRALRGLMLVLAVNAVVLAIFGTAQKLLHAPGLFFGAVPSPQKYFFASFVYHNHWGAFMILCVAACLGLVGYYVRHHAARDFFHSPAFTGLSSVLILGATIPLSASRSGTIIAALLLGGAFLHWIYRLVRRRRQFNESIVPPITLAAVAALIALGAVWYLGRETISTRVALTVDQLQHARASRAPDQRARLYHDTWTMAQAKPWFGWGMGSYPHVFTIYNTQAPIPHFPVFFHDAHSDWLQSLAEHGWLGTMVLVAAAVVPLGVLRRKGTRNPLTGYLLFGCSLVVVYGALEFPFGNYGVVLTWWLCFFSAIQYGRLHDREMTRRENEEPFRAEPRAV